MKPATILLTFYSLGMCLTYVLLSDFIREQLDEEELFNQQMRDPAERNSFEIVVFLMAVAWIVTLPLLLRRRRRK